MEFYFILSLVLIIYLTTLNFLMKKFKICLDVEGLNEKHKSLLRINNNTPLSGTFYFLLIFLLFFLDLDKSVLIILSLLFLLGLAADSKIITSYKSRIIFQFIFLFIMFFINKDIVINTGFLFINILMKYDILRILICVFFFMVLINGFNLIDGTNCLCLLNFLIISIFVYFLIFKLDINQFDNEIKILIISLLIFLLFNFFGLNFLGDGAAYGIGFLLGYILLKISLVNQQISPYFIANLLWYPAFENFFSFFRRLFIKKNKYLPDNQHLHQLLFKFLKKYISIKKNFLISSLVGILINFILFIGYLLGYNFLDHTKIQIIIILTSILVYLLTYFYVKKKII
jgi:UDP-GlcNAc:undecaprenyl-phosphate GlcNAc-1-phosphate transferase